LRTDASSNDGLAPIVVAAKQRGRGCATLDSIGAGVAFVFAAAAKAPSVRYRTISVAVMPRFTWLERVEARR
jgi:hypothetical protein